MDRKTASKPGNSILNRGVGNGVFTAGWGAVGGNTRIAHQHLLGDRQRGDPGDGHAPPTGGLATEIADTPHFIAPAAVEVLISFPVVTRQFPCLTADSGSRFHGFAESQNRKLGVALITPHLSPVFQTVRPGSGIAGGDLAPFEALCQIGNTKRIGFVPGGRQGHDHE